MKKPTPAPGSASTGREPGRDKHPGTGQGTAEFARAGRPPELDERSEPVFRALADPTRRQILQDLRDGELTAGEIAAAFPITGPSVSRHLAILRAADLVRERRDGNRIFYSLSRDRLALCVGGFLSAVCPDQVLLRHRRAGRANGERS